MQNVKKRINIWNLFFSFLLSFTILIDSKIVIHDEVLNVFSNVTLESFTGKDIFLFFFLFILNLVIIYLIEILYKKINNKQIKKDVKKKNIFWISFFLFLLFWLPYILSYFPGGVFSDTFVSISQLQGKASLNAQNPMLYTLLLKFFFFLGSNQFTTSIIFFQVFQILGCAFSISYFIHILYKKNLPNICTYLTIAFFSLFPLIPFYVLSIWKDTPFHFVLFLFITFLFDRLTCEQDFLSDKKNVFIYCLLAFLICFLRTNGIFIMVGTTFVLLLYQYKKEKKKNVYFLWSSILTLFLVFGIQGPLYSALHLEKNTMVESMAIPFQQISYSVLNGAELTKEEQEYFENVISKEVLTKIHKPFLFDPIKWDSNFNGKYFTNHKVKFIKLWFSLLPKNIKNYTQSYLLQTLGYWDIFKSSEEAYISIYTFPGYQEIEQKDLIDEFTHVSIRNRLEPKVYISSALFFWMMLISMVITITFKKYRYLLLYLPAFLTWLSIMIGTPIAFSLRYVYILVLMLPLDFLIPLFPYKK